MEKAVRVEASEVKRSFVLADMGKRIFGKGFGEYMLQKEYNCLEDKVEAFSPEELDKIIGKDENRLRSYNSVDWYFDSMVTLGEMGSYPKMGDLAIGLTLGNIVSTATLFEGIKMASEAISDFDFSHYENPESPRQNIFPDTIKRTDSIIENIDFVMPKFPLILLPGGMIRGKYNDWAKDNGESECRLFKYDIDDGNNRALAYVLAGREDAPAFVGKYRG
tara:strand:+ start:1357 stop:2016 length:660 start_codon:yes stop_codon:yes gene_type:complete